MTNQTTHKDARYRVIVYSKETQLETIIEYPITCKFTVTRGVFSESNSATIQLYNLAPATRELIFQDQYQLDESKWKYVTIEAGYGGQALPQVFFGRILQAYSQRAGGAVDVVTEIQAVALDIFDVQTSHTFAAGTTYKDAYKSIAASMPNVKIGNIGSLEGIFQTETTFDGNVLEELNKLTGGHAFVDNGTLNTIMENEVIDVPVPVISDNTVLLGTPIRRDANIEVKTLFLPDIISGQLVEVKSSVQPQFNGQFKLVGFTHDCLISPTQAGTRITTMNLWIGPLLPNSDQYITGGAAPVEFSKVKGEEVSSVNPKSIQPKWIRPCEGAITSQFGYRIDPMDKTRKYHSGWDIKVAIGTPIKAIADGKVYYSGDNDPKGYGRYIIIDHGKVNGKIVTSEYGHLSSRLVRTGQMVKQGQKIGLSGNTGKSTGPHLHITIREGQYKGKPVSPSNYLH